MTRDAFNNIIHKTYRKLYLIAFRALRNQQEAEDVVQDVFLKMWTMKEKLDEYRDTEALAVIMTRNNSVDLLRKRRHTDYRSFGSGRPETELSPSPHDLLTNAESLSVVNEIIERLPANYREVVQLREIDGLSYEEIAVITFTNINSLRVNLSRARVMIREQFKQYSNERGDTKGAAGKVL